MGQKIITLSGAATDVLYALFYRGALQSGDLPSKSGAAELRELGFAETRHTATQYQKENYFTFLTAEGQAFAVEHLVNTRFGVPAGGYIGSPLDALDEIADQGGYTPDEMRDAVEYIKRTRQTKALGKALAEPSPFVMKDGQVFIKDAFIQPATTAGTKVDSNSGGSATYNCNMRIKVDGADKTIRDKVHDLIAPYMTGEATEYTDVLVDEVMNLFDKPETRRLIDSCITESIRLHCRPGGLIWQTLRRL
ncbi:TPA: Fur-regulated protein [Citrobacter koseri]